MTTMDSRISHVIILSAQINETAESKFMKFFPTSRKYDDVCVK